jgi:hypothetical protein
MDIVNRIESGIFNKEFPLIHNEIEIPFGSILIYQDEIYQLGMYIRIDVYKLLTKTYHCKVEVIFTNYNYTVTAVKYYDAEFLTVSYVANHLFDLKFGSTNIITKFLSIRHHKLDCTACQICFDNMGDIPCSQCVGIICLTCRDRQLTKYGHCPFCRIEYSDSQILLEM